MCIDMTNLKKKSKKILRRMADVMSEKELQQQKNDFLKSRYEQLNYEEYNMLTKEYEKPPGFFKDCTRMQIYKSVEARDKKITTINKELKRAKNAERCYE